MGSSKTHYFLGTQLLATTHIRPMWDDSTISFSSTAYFCPVCGEVWARIMIEGAEWLPTNSPCPKHTNGLRKGGYFIAPWRKTYWELPQEVLKYELQLLLDRYDKGEMYE